MSRRTIDVTAREILRFAFENDLREEQMRGRAADIDADRLQFEPLLRLDVAIDGRGGFRIEMGVIENVFVQRERSARRSVLHRRTPRIDRRRAVRL